MCSGQITTSPSSRGPAAGPDLVNGEREHVGGRVDASVAQVQLANLLRRDELHRQMSVGHARRSKRRLRRRPQQGLLPRDDLDLDQAFFRAERSSGACVSA